MKTLRKIAWLLWVILSGYVVAWTFGLFLLGPLFLYFVVTGRIIIRGYWRLIGCALRGRLLVLTNHPTVYAETFGMGHLMFPWYLICPWCFIWTIPDKKLLDSWDMPEWVRTALRCIVVERSSRMARGRGTAKALDVLWGRGVIIAHPEMGRTFGEANRRAVPLEHGGRLMQKINGSKLTDVAHESRAHILPGWIEVTYYRDSVPLDECVRRMFGKKNARYRPIIYNFRRPAYRPKQPFDLARENARLQEEIFNA